MGALAPVTHWIPEDDLLLKNAVEAGASLESLAKGAVQFSRRYTVRELQDRWHSLLYDPVVSAEASFRMSEVERFNPNLSTKFARPGNSKEIRSSFGKRNAGSVRNGYYSLRKKMRCEPYHSMDLSFLVPSNDSNCVGNGNEPHLGFEESHLDIIHNAFPEILGDDGCIRGFHNPIEGIQPTQKDDIQNEVPHTMGDSDLPITENMGTLGCDAIHDADTNLKSQLASHEPKDATPSTVCYLTELSNSLFNDTDPLMDVDGRDMIDKSYYDGLSSLLNQGHNASQDHTPNTNQTPPSTIQKHLGDVSMSDNGISVLDGMNALSTSEVKKSVDATALDPHPEIVKGVICCVLNMEDPEIPSNEGVFIFNQYHPMSVSALAKRNFKDSGNTASTFVRDISAKKEKGEGYPVHIQKKNPGLPPASSQKKLEMGQILQAGESRVKFELPCTDSGVISSGGSVPLNTVRACTNVPQSTQLKDDDKEVATMKPMSAKPCIISDEYKSCHEKDGGGIKLEQDVLPSIHNPHASNAEDGSINVAVPELDIDTSPSDEHHIESDADLPSYSDIEAMILDMDLDPNDQDIFELEVSKYQNEDTKRTIVRLEQAANSHMQRTIASHGAFAVLYGRCWRHYIKKHEVLLGRSTEDFVVDIDLGRERRGSKISRRQATIWLDEDGSFHMKNLGKYPISVNDKEVDPGRSLILNSGCLIEIRGMPFIFETNQTRIKEYMDSLGKGDKVG